MSLYLQNEVWAFCVVLILSFNLGKEKRTQKETGCHSCITIMEHLSNAPKPEDQRYNVKNPNNEDHKADQDNASKQKNPEHEPTNPNK